MIIRRLTIRHYRGVEEREFIFPAALAVLPQELAETAVKAIGIVLKSTELAGEPEAWELEADSEITAEILLKNEKILVRVTVSRETETAAWQITDGKRQISPVEYFYRIHVPPAEEKENRYLANRSYREVLDSYRDPEQYYPPKDFSKATEGIGDTVVFRQKAMRMTQGREMEKMDNLQLFVRVNDLWQSVQEVRDLNHEAWPVFLMQKGKKDNNELGKQISRAMRRQVFCSASRRQSKNQHGDP